MNAPLRVALVAHDAMKEAMYGWVRRHTPLLGRHRLYATGTTGAGVAAATGLSVERMLSGPQGGDQQIGGMIANGEIDVLIFFIDPLSAAPHDVDVKALLRISTLRNIPFACNEATADGLVAGALGGPA
ncbi:MAG: methylglyoxal synthase [Pseudomonadota bacterium]